MLLYFPSKLNRILTTQKKDLKVVNLLKIISVHYFFSLLNLNANLLHIHFFLVVNYLIYLFKFFPFEFDYRTILYIYKLYYKKIYNLFFIINIINFSLIQNIIICDFLRFL